MKKVKPVGGLNITAILVALIIVAPAFYYIYKNNIYKEKLLHSTVENGESYTEPKTKIIIYTPKLGNYPQKEGECWTSSIVLQGRPNSLRCMVGNIIQDPCFRLGDKIICDTNPLEEGDEFELVYKKELPDNSDNYENNNHFSWIYQLEDDSYCFLTQGTAGSISTGELYYYLCDNNKVIIGRVDKSHDLWKAEVGYLYHDGSNKLLERTTESIVVAWE